MHSVRATTGLAHQTFSSGMEIIGFLRPENLNRGGGEVAVTGRSRLKRVTMSHRGRDDGACQEWPPYCIIIHGTGKGA
jgi:hypothetical protein